MNKKDKYVLLTLVLFEVISFAIHRPQNLEMFSFAWAFVFFVILVYRWQAEALKRPAIGSYDVDGYQNSAIASGNSDPRINVKGFQKKISYDMIIGLIFVVNLLVSFVSH
jgi:hypothetical protein